jgi:hypothetical protein
MGGATHGLMPLPTAAAAMTYSMSTLMATSLEG